MNHKKQKQQHQKEEQLRKTSSKMRRKWKILKKECGRRRWRGELKNKLAQLSNNLCLIYLIGKKHTHTNITIL